ncbi:hypothetical protein NC651_001063 [Populus alba x Populus x berolinensis]|nr:hypothetical protein NC651_001063 [Populus alba x Populus x berolinensis]
MGHSGVVWVLYCIVSWLVLPWKVKSHAPELLAMVMPLARRYCFLKGNVLGTAFQPASKMEGKFCSLRWQAWKGELTPDGYYDAGR